MGVSRNSINDFIVVMRAHGDCLKMLKKRNKRSSDGHDLHFALKREEIMGSDVITVEKRTYSLESVHPPSS